MNLGEWEITKAQVMTQSSGRHDDDINHIAKRPE